MSQLLQHQVKEATVIFKCVETLTVTFQLSDVSQSSLADSTAASQRSGSIPPY